MLLQDFDYVLPAEAIARHPAPERGASRLMVLGRHDGSIHHQTFSDLETWLRPGDLLVVNDTRVMKARLVARREPGQGRVELLLVEPVAREGDPAHRWRCLARPAKKLRPGRVLTLEGGPSVRVAGLEEEGFVLVDLPEAGAQLAERHGRLPLPPYLERSAEPADDVRYQTVYARDDALGSVAAPTAGLHFTPSLLERLRARGIETASVTLHVGPGTFLPVRAERIEAHRMHEERFHLPEATQEAVLACREAGGRIVAVGTTVTRVLESVGWPPDAGEGRTNLFIRPGHRFRCVDVLLTNFHLPRSTLLILVSAFAGRERVLGAYREAVGASYRFFSYGDAMLIR